MIYQWANLAIELLCRDSAQTKQLDALWQTFFCLTPDTSSDIVPVVSLYLQEQTEDGARYRKQMCQKQLWYSGDASVRQSEIGLSLHLGGTELAVDSNRGCASCWIAPTFWCYSLAEQRDFFMRGLLLLLRSKKHYGLHANGVVKENAGMLVVGPSGRGKTTLTLSLVQAGWRYLGDDVTVLHETSVGVEALAFQQGFACTSQTTEFFPQLPTAMAQSLDTVRQKQWLPLDTYQATQLSTACSPQVLLFPTIVDADESRLVPLNETQTLLGLMEQSAALFIEADAAAQQMTMLQQLGRQARGYQLLAGRDVYMNPAAVAARLGELLD